MKTLKERLVHIFIISIFCSLYFLVATISMINSVEFFDLAHSGAMSWSLAIGFEMGAAASLAAIIILEKTNRTMVWFLFLLLTAFQMMANSYHAFVNLENYMGWIELFGLEDEEPLFQKRLLAIVSGAVLPIVALGFIKSLTDYAKTKPKPDDTKELDDYYEARNKKIEDVVEKRRRAENFEKAESEAIAKESNVKQEPVESIDAVDEIRKEFEKQATPFNPKPEPTSNELDVHIDEATGTTYVKTKGIKPQPAPPKANPL
jgi:hypothetical protein